MHESIKNLSTEYKEIKPLYEPGNYTIALARCPLCFSDKGEKHDALCYVEKVLALCIDQETYEKAIINADK